MRATSPPAPDLFRLDGRVAFVSGAAGHLGRAMSLALSEAGAHVIVNGRSAKKLVELADTIEKNKGSAEIAAFDIGDLSRARDFFALRGRLDILVNNAISMTPKPGAALTEGEFAETYKTGVIA